MFAPIRVALCRILVGALAGVFLLAAPYTVQAGGLEDVEREILAIVERVRPTVLRLTAVSEASPKAAPGKFSGILISPDGDVVTTAAFLHKGVTVTAVDMDGRIFDTDIIGVDADTNVALLRLRVSPEGGPLPFVAMSQADATPVGSWTLAVGNPFGLENSVVTGIISGRDRALFGNQGLLTDLLQTTVPVNAGDAGGLVVNSKGEMIGMIASTYRQTSALMDWVGKLMEFESGVETAGKIHALVSEALQSTAEPAEKEALLSSGLKALLESSLQEERRAVLVELLRTMPDMSPPQSTNFAVPARTIRVVVESIRSLGRVPRPWMGVRVEDLTAEEKANINLAGCVRVVETYPDGPASTAGLQAGDLIFEMADRAIVDFVEMRALLLTLAPGTRIHVAFLRGEEIMRVEMELADKADRPEPPKKKR